MSHSMNTYSRIPVAFTRGERVWVWDESGKKYLDALAGIAVNTLGHGHPKLTRAIAERLHPGLRRRPATPARDTPNSRFTATTTR